MTDGAVCDTNVSVEITLRAQDLSPVRIVTDSGGVSEEAGVTLRCAGMTRDSLMKAVRTNFRRVAGVAMMASSPALSYGSVNVCVRNYDREVLASRWFNPYDGPKTSGMAARYAVTAVFAEAVREGRDNDAEGD